MAHIDDRWFTTGRQQTDRHGKGRRWRVRYHDPSGAERSRSFDKKVEAERFLTQVKADLQRGSYVDPDAGRVTLRKYAADWLAAQTFEATTRERVDQRLRVHVLPALGGKTLGELAQRPSAIQAWLRALPGSPGHIQTILANLSSIMNAAVDDGLIIRNPCAVKSVRAPAITRRTLVPWTAEQVAVARAALPERYQALADLGAGLGLRQGEAFGLALEDVEWLKGVVHVRRQVRIVGYKLCFAPPKRGKERDVPLPESVGHRLSAHIKRYPATPVALPLREPGGKIGEPVHLFFTTTARHALDRAYFHRLWRSARQEAGMSNDRENGFHALRHHYASVLLAGGVDIRTLASCLGHTDPAFTLRVYAHLMPGGAERAQRIIDASLSALPDGPVTALAHSD